jgi:SAM-dependent methyltransferase
MALRPGDDHYTAYVGPPLQYDFMGATQFRLLASLGLRGGDRVLDFGCGSLRAGRLLIPYLDPGCYFGVEPNEWLVRDAIANEIGEDMVRIKRPVFDDNDDFRADVFGTTFRFIVAQSIFSHASADVVVRALAGFRDVLVPGGHVACTFVDAPTSEMASHAPGWTYPACVRFTAGEVAGFFAQAGLASVRLPWYHPRQVWYLAARPGDWLPSPEECRHLGGAVLNAPEFSASVRG